MKTVIRIVAIGAILAALLFFHQTYQRLKQREAQTQAAEQARKSAEAAKPSLPDPKADAAKSASPSAPPTLEPFVPSLPPAKDAPLTAVDGSEKASVDKAGAEKSADKAPFTDKAATDKAGADKSPAAERTPPALASVPVAGADKAEKGEKAVGVNKSEKVAEPPPSKAPTEPIPQLQAVPVK